MIIPFDKYVWNLEIKLEENLFFSLNNFKIEKDYYLKKEFLFFSFIPENSLAFISKNTFLKLVANEKYYSGIFDPEIIDTNKVVDNYYKQKIKIKNSNYIIAGVIWFFSLAKDSNIIPRINVPQYVFDNVDENFIKIAKNNELSRILLQIENIKNLKNINRFQLMDI